MGDWLTKSEFKKFVENDHTHLIHRVGKIERTVSFIKGQLLVLIPLVLAVLGLVFILIIK